MKCFNFSQRPGKRDVEYGIGFSKLEIAKIHINSAIEMLFNEMDPISVNAVASSGFQIVRDISKKRNLSALETYVEKVRVEDVKKFWTQLNQYWSYFKHADKDTYKNFEGMDVLVNDFCIFLSINLYRELREDITVEMEVFSAWFLCMRTEIPYDEEHGEVMMQYWNKFNANEKSREESLDIGRLGLEVRRRQI